jgi:hypothetical protein
MSRSRTHHKYRDIATFYAIANSKPGEELIVHNRDATIDFRIKPNDVQDLKDYYGLKNKGEK